MLPEKKDKLETRVHAVREVRVPVPPELLPRIVDFYQTLLELPPWPPADQVPGAWAVGSRRSGVVFVFSHDPVVDPFRRRLVLRVRSLDRAAIRLDEREWPYQRHRGLFFTDQWLELNDPVGHRLELRQSLDL